MLQTVKVVENIPSYVGSDHSQFWTKICQDEMVSHVIYLVKDCIVNNVFNV